MGLNLDRLLGTKLFILRCLRNPRQLGAVLPTSGHVGTFLARHADVEADFPIIELGGGSGSVTRALIKSGIAPSRLYVIELDPELAAYLKKTLPDVTVIQGDAANLSSILPADIIGKVQRVISSLPMINMPPAIRRKILESCFEVMTPGGIYLQFTYAPLSSINDKIHQLKKKRLGTILRNVPPATVWQYTRDVATAGC